MKHKTNKAAKKRFKITGTGKAKRRRVHQSHFNAKDTGQETRRKHKGVVVDQADQGRILDLLPYKD